MKGVFVLTIYMSGLFWGLVSTCSARRSTSGVQLGVSTRASRSAFIAGTSAHYRKTTAPKTLMSDARAGTFFNPVPEDSEYNNKNDNDTTDRLPPSTLPLNSDLTDFQSEVVDLLRRRKQKAPKSTPAASSSSAGGGVYRPKDEKPFVGIGPALNNPTQPEYDEQGFTLYANERTGEKTRVFEALVDYPCQFTLKIVGANEGLFVEEMLAVVAASCEITDGRTLSHSVRQVGKWTSVTVQAPVQSADMLYQLYQNVDRDPRVKFKF